MRPIIRATGAAAWLMLATGLMLAACGETDTPSSRSQAALATGPGDTAKGGELFRQRCANCHGERGDVSANRTSALLNGLAATHIAQTLKGYQKPSQDAPWWTEFKSGLSDREINDLLAYIDTFSESAAPGG